MSDSHNTLPLTVNPRSMSTALVCQPVAHLKQTLLESTSENLTSDSLSTVDAGDLEESDQNQLIVLHEDQTSDPKEVDTDVTPLMNPKVCDDETLSEATLRLFL